ncbi:MFS general substrate transporter [Lepidopterella palustris CBS 459.81]|uniref:MFS general substrate transporter n=1 Tax=Lepidopterella palustris CBS 459.81 TaxID=1314670 RepID=A0A8E2DYT5_9PEZI|nr:MFS general substrate transporter [Lepidopterella palustris CBS 459.81]
MSRRASTASTTASKEREKQLESGPTAQDEESTLPKPNKQPGENPNLVKWDEHDPKNPRNWTTGYKCWVTFQLGMLALAASLGSSITAPATDAISSYVGISREVTVLQVSLYILGYALGPLCWAPTSEIWGRRWSMLPATFCLGLFSIGTATSKTATAIFITRFFGGVFGSAPVSNVSAALGDIWEPRARGTAITFYAIMVVGGPTLGPIIGSALVANPHLGWRWTEYIEAIWVFTIFALCLFALPEVYAPVLLKMKAQRLRNETGNDALFHPHEQLKLDFNSIITKHLTRPVRMLCTEPMVTCIAFYASFVFAILYLTLEVFPIVFEQQRGYSPVVASLPFLGLFIGILCAVIINLANEPRYRRIAMASKGKPVPEARLPPMIIGSFLFPIGLFWFGWTADPKYHWAIPTVATGFIGAGFNLIFQQCVNFLVDTYQLYAASALSANTFLRSLMAAGLPMAAMPMFHNMGVGPAASVLGAVAVAVIPVPLLFLRFGLALRRRSTFAPVED